MNVQAGRIYILRNPYFKDAVIKIGRTKRASEARASEISAVTGVPSDFEVLYEEEVLDISLAEQLIHKKLRGARINPRREFFRVPLKDAVKAVFETCLKVNKSALKNASTRIIIVMRGDFEQNTRNKLAEILCAYRGKKVAVYIYYQGYEANALLRLGDIWKVRICPSLFIDLRRIKNVEDLWWTTTDTKIASSIPPNQCIPF